MTTQKENEESMINILIDLIKDELVKSDIRTEVIKPILIYLLYLIEILVLVLINLIVFLVLVL